MYIIIPDLTNRVWFN